MADDDLRERLGATVPGALLAVPEGLVDEGWKIMEKNLPKGRIRFVLKTIPKAPGYGYDAVQVVTAKDKGRALAGVAGGFAGGFLGSAGGLLGKIGGHMAGEAGAEWLYDHHDELARKAAETARWIKDRTAHVANRAAHGFDRGMPPYSTPLR